MSTLNPRQRTVIAHVGARGFVPFACPELRAAVGGRLGNTMLALRRRGLVSYGTHGEAGEYGYVLTPDGRRAYAAGRAQVAA